MFVFWNNTLESLWEMKDNTKLQVISFESVTKLKNIDTLKDSSVEYVNFDSFNNSGNGQKILFDPKILEEMKNLKHLSLKYTDLFINR